MMKTELMLKRMWSSLLECRIYQAVYASKSFKRLTTKSPEVVECSCGALYNLFLWIKDEMRTFMENYGQTFSTLYFILIVKSTGSCPSATKLL